MEQPGEDSPPYQLHGVVSLGDAHHVGNGPAGQVCVKAEGMQVAIGRTVGSPEVSRDHGHHVAVQADEGGGLDGAKTAGTGNSPVGGEARVFVHVEYHNLRTLAGRPPARRMAVVDHGKVLEKVATETGLADDAQ